MNQLTKRHRRLLATLLVALPLTAHALPIGQEALVGSYDAETQAALRDELATCPGCAVEALDDGSPNVVVPPDAHPNATGNTAAGPSSWVPSPAAACTTTTPTLSREATFFRRLGNTWIGVYYQAASRASVAPSTSRTGAVGRLHHGDSLNAAGATVFGANLDVVRGESVAEVNTVSGRLARSRLYARTRVGPMMLVGEQTTSASGSVYLPRIGVATTYWEGDYSFTLGPIPVTVRGAVQGSANYQTLSRMTPTEAYVRGAPAVGLYAFASLSANAGVVAMGVDGQLALAEASLPTSAGMALTSAGYTHTLDSAVAATFLRGRIDAWVRVGFWRFKKTWRRNLARWDGYGMNAPLYTATGSLPICDPYGILGGGAVGFAP
jgi:hypothetical protein